MPLEVYLPFLLVLVAQIVKLLIRPHKRANQVTNKNTNFQGPMASVVSRTDHDDSVTAECKTI